MSDIPTGKESRTSGGPELPPEPAQSRPPPVRLNPKPEKKKRLKVKKSEPLKISSRRLFSISEDAPLLVDMDDELEIDPQPTQTTKPKHSMMIEDRLPDDLVPSSSVRIHKKEPLSFAAVPTPKPQEITPSAAKQLEGDTSAPALTKGTSKQPKHKSPASMYEPSPSEKLEDERKLGADASGKALAWDTVDSERKASKPLLMAPIVLSTDARKPGQTPKLSSSLPASEELTGKSKDISNLGAATSGKALLVETEDSERKRSVPTSEGLPMSTKDTPATEYQPHSVRVRKSEALSFTPAPIQKQQDANSMNATADVTTAASSTGLVLSVEDETPARRLRSSLPAAAAAAAAVSAAGGAGTGTVIPVNDDTPAPKSKLERNVAAASVVGVSGAVSAASGIILPAEDDSLAPAPKLKRKLPPSTKYPEDRDDEPATEFAELWSSGVPVFAALPPSSEAYGSKEPAEELVVAALPPSSEVYGSKEPAEEPADLEAQASEEVGSETPFYKRKCLVAITIALLLIIVLVPTIVVVRNNENAEGGSGGEPTSTPVPTVFRPTISPTISPTSILSSFTVVIQLDENPQETGWTLVCDGETLENVEPGTYAFLAARPNFRLEYETMTQTDSECELTITDTGGDGLNGGYYEVYYGDLLNVGYPSALLADGTVSGSMATANFTVTPPTIFEPTASPTSFVVDQPNCTICPDGSAPGFLDAVPEGWGGFTCSQIDTLLSQATPKLNATDCKLVQDAAAYSCGCTNHCTTICPDGISDPDPVYADSIVLVNGEEITCDDFQSQVASASSNSKDQCLSANYLGEEICGCPPTSGFCSLCQDGAVPPPTNLQRDIVPGFSCLDLSGFAYALRDTDLSGTYFQLCTAFKSVGAYCGCEVSTDDSLQFCRLCGGNEDLLPEPARIVNSTILGGVTTCIHVEFASNANATTSLACSEFRNDTANECCY